MNRVAVSLVVFGAFCFAAVPAHSQEEWDAKGRSLSELIDAIRQPVRVTDRCRAAEALAVFGHTAVEPLCQLLRDERVVVRSYACLALTRMGRQAEAAVPALIAAALEETSEPLQPRIVDVLASIGPAAAAAVPALSQLLAEPRRDLQRSVLAALASIGDAGAIRVIDDAFRRGDSAFRLRAIEVLPRYPASAAELMPTLIAAASDDDPHIADCAMVLVGQLGETAVERLLALLVSDNPEMRRRAAMSLSHSRAGAVAAAPALTAALTDPESAVRFWALKALSVGGPPSPSAAPQLIACLQDPDPDVRWQAVKTVERLGLRPQAIVALEALQVDPHPVIRQAALRALASRD